MKVIEERRIDMSIFSKIKQGFAIVGKFIVKGITAIGKFLVNHPILTAKIAIIVGTAVASAIGAVAAWRSRRKSKEGNNSRSSRRHDDITIAERYIAERPMKRSAKEARKPFGDFKFGPRSKKKKNKRTLADFKIPHSRLYEKPLATMMHDMGMNVNNWEDYEHLVDKKKIKCHSWKYEKAMASTDHSQMDIDDKLRSMKRFGVFHPELFSIPDKIAKKFPILSKAVAYQIANNGVMSDHFISYETDPELIVRDRSKATDFNHPGPVVNIHQLTHMAKKNRWDIKPLKHYDVDYVVMADEFKMLIPYDYYPELLEELVDDPEEYFIDIETNGIPRTYLDMHDFIDMVHSKNL
jgi:hypothetical protein